VLSLIALFFMSTTGVTVYKHYCNHEGELYRLFIDIEHECDSEEAQTHECQFHELAAQVDETNCCDAEETIHENCCTDDVQVYQIDSDLIAHNGEISLDYVPVFAFSTPLVLDYIFKKHTDQPKENSPPFTIPITERLAQLQMYLL